MHINPDTKTNLQVDVFQKTIYAIVHNPIQKATEYLEQRKINTRLLPDESYWYDTLPDAVVFMDSERKLINRRIIRPVNGSPKAKNQGRLINSIYDRSFKQELDTVFVHEGVINALSMPAQRKTNLRTEKNYAGMSMVDMWYWRSTMIMRAINALSISKLLFFPTNMT